MVHLHPYNTGLAVSFVLARYPKAHKNNSSNKTSDMFAMIGTIFLWMYWPSFNGALATQSQQHRVIINTLLSLSACCMHGARLSTRTSPPEDALLY
jgi:ammonium transporter Rh